MSQVDFLEMRQRGSKIDLQMSKLMYSAFLPKCFLPRMYSRLRSCNNYDCRTSSSMNGAFFQGCKIFIIVAHLIKLIPGTELLIHSVKEWRTDVHTLVTVDAHILVNA